MRELIPIAVSTALPVTFTVFLALLIFRVAARKILRDRVGRDLEGERQTAIGELDVECRACGELFDDPELAAHHARTQHPGAAVSAVIGPHAG